MDTVFGALNRGDRAALHGAITPDGEFRSHLGAIQGLVYTGYDGIERYLDDLAETFEDVQWDVIGVEEGTGDRILVTVDVVARGRGSGAEVTQRMFNVWTLRDGLIALNEVFLDRAAGVEASGIAT